KTDPQRQGATVDAGDFAGKFFRCLPGNIDNRGQLRGGMDGQDMVTAVREESLIWGEKISNGWRRRRRRGVKRGQSRVKLFACDASTISVFLSIQNKDGGNDFDLMLLKKIGGQIGS